MVVQVLPQEVAPNWDYFQDYFLCHVELNGGVSGQLLYGAMIVLV
jgi:hypothetical protein